MLSDVYSTTDELMAKVVDNLRKELLTIRTGRANASILDRIKVDYYGTNMPINQMASVNTPEPRVLIIQPWDISTLSEIQKAIQKSDLGVNPSNDGKVIRLVFPEPTEERRKEMVKSINKLAEGARISVRNIRRESIEQIKKMEKNKEISEDDMIKGQDEIQKRTDKSIKIIDDVINKKENEIMEV